MKKELLKTLTVLATAALVSSSFCSVFASESGGVTKKVEQKHSSSSNSDLAKQLELKKVEELKRVAELKKAEEIKKAAELKKN